MALPPQAQAQAQAQTQAGTGTKNVSFTDAHYRQLPDDFRKAGLVQLLPMYPVVYGIIGCIAATQLVRGVAHGGDQAA